VALKATRNSRGDMHNNFVKATHAGKRAAILIPFLDVAFAVSGTNHENIITWCIWRPSRLPERPREVSAGIIDLGVAPLFATVETQFDSRNTAVTAVRHPFHFDRLR